MLKDIDLDKIKFLQISQKDLVLALDRLTRFKYPEIKYYRVFSDLISKYLLFPKLTKNDIRELDINLLRQIVERIWNDSVKQYSPQIPLDKGFNKILKKELLNTYNLSDDIKKLVDIDLNINGVLALVKKNQSVPLNIKRLLLIEKDYTNLKNKREELGLRFPVEKVLLCEGITEEILMPKFASLYGYNFDKNGIKLISAGGKNQVAKLYCELKDELNIPIFILLDADAVETSNRIATVKRDCDDIYLIKHGEFEDIFSLNLIKRTINNRYKNICECTVSDFQKDMPMTKILAEFFRINNLGDYQKSDFAKEILNNIKYDTDLTEEIRTIINEIKK